jgi:hypothetical protein
MNLSDSSSDHVSRSIAGRHTVPFYPRSLSAIPTGLDRRNAIQSTPSQPPPNFTIQKFRGGAEVQRTSPKNSFFEFLGEAGRGCSIPHDQNSRSPRMAWIIRTYVL